MPTIDLLVRSDSVFTAGWSQPQPGYVAIRDGRIVDAGPGEAPAALRSGAASYIDAGARTVLPGLIDVHTFFPGWAAQRVGADMSGTSTTAGALNRLAATLPTAAGAPSQPPILAHGLAPALAAELSAALDERFPTRPVVVFCEGNESCAMNATARERFGFSPDRCWPEAYVGLMREYLTDRPWIDEALVDYQQMLLSRGVTSVKEMGFDDYSGFTEVLADVECTQALKLRWHFMSQPVARAMDLEFGHRMRDRFVGDRVRFSGYNQMTDGSIGDGEGELLAPYQNSASTGSLDIDWTRLRGAVLAADAKGFRFSLHAQGDGAVHRSTQIFAECAYGADGRLRNRHAITDLEFTHPDDLAEMAALGVIAEIYPQITSRHSRAEYEQIIAEQVGAERGRRYWARRTMQDAGVRIACGTDLPLLIPDIAQSAVCAVEGYCGMDPTSEPFQTFNTLSLPELATAWTLGGAIDLGIDDEVGRLASGYRADLIVLSGDLWAPTAAERTETRVDITLVDGEVVYQREGSARC